MNGSVRRNGKSARLMCGKAILQKRGTTLKYTMWSRHCGLAGRGKLHAQQGQNILDFIRRIAEMKSKPQSAVGWANSGGDFKIITAIQEPAVIARIFPHLGLPARAPPRSRARSLPLF
jgi:hypothetical protein